MTSQNQNESTCCQECKDGNLQGLIFCNYEKETQPAHVSDVIWGFIVQNREDIREKQKFTFGAKGYDEYCSRKKTVLEQLTNQLHAYIEENVDASIRQEWFDKVNQDHQEMMSAKTIGGVRVGVAAH